jgi:hypothetical protein
MKKSAEEGMRQGDIYFSIFSQVMLQTQVTFYSNVHSHQLADVLLSFETIAIKSNIKWT